MCSKAASYTWRCLSHSQDPRSGKGRGSIHHYPWYSTRKMFVSLLINLGLATGLRGLSSKERYAPTRRYNSDSTEREATLGCS